MPSERRRWTQKEDEILKIAVGEDVERIDWLSVAEFLPGRNNKECRKRWYQKFASDTNHGSWTEAEDERLRAAINQHGTKWTLVARDVGTRNSEQCSKRWNGVLNPELDRSPWTTEEDQLLLSSVETVGRNWKVISELHFPNRAALSLKNRHALLLRRRARRSLSHDTHPRSSSTSNLPDAGESASITDMESEDNESSSPGAGQKSALPTSTSMNAPGPVGFSLAPFEYTADDDFFQAPAAPKQHDSTTPTVPMDITAYNDIPMDDINKAIDDSAFAQHLPQLPPHSQADVSLWQYPQTNLGISTPASTTTSSKTDSWEEILCLGVHCPRKELEKFKLALLEAVTKVGPGDGDERVQIKLTLSKK